VKFHLMRLDTLRRGRSHWDQQWEEAAMRVIPAHRDTFQSYANGRVYGSEGQKKTEDMFDATASIACQRFAAVMESLATPQSGIWHRLVPADKLLKKNRAVRMYFDDVTDLLFSLRYRPVANFVGNSQQVYQSLGAYGNGTLFIDQPDSGRGLRYRNVHLGETYYDVNHAGVVDTMYRCFWLDARQAIQKFGDALPDSIKSKVDAKQNVEKFEFVHCVYPRADYDPGRVDVKGKIYASVYISRLEEKQLSEGGFNSFPYATARYTQASGEIYGRGPAQWVLPSIKILNEQKKTVLKQGHRIVDPVLLVHDDGIMDGFSLRSGAMNSGAVNKDGRPLVIPLSTGNLTVGDKMMDMEKSIINDAFLITLFQILIDTPQMTATEVLERAREKGMLIAPTSGRLQAEFLGPMIERELDLLDQQGILPAMPAILAQSGGAYKIEYDSPMARMQRSEKAAGFLRAFGVATDFAQRTGDPSALDWFEIDVAMPEIMDIQGSPAAWTRSPEQVEERRAERAQQAQTQQAIEAAPALAGVAKAMPEIQKAQSSRPA